MIHDQEAMRINLEKKLGLGALAQSIGMIGRLREGSPWETCEIVDADVDGVLR